MKNIWVYVEMDAGRPTDMGLQCLAKGRELADQTGGSVSALALGTKAGADLVGYGADHVFATEDVALTTYIPPVFSAIVSDVLGKNQVDVALFPASTQGNDLASVVAAKLGVSSVIDCHALALDGNALLQTRIEYDGKVYSHLTASTPPAIVTLHDGIAEVGDKDDSRSGELQAVETSAGADHTEVEVVAREIAAKRVNLKDARIIVSGGAGVGSKANFQLIEQLAATLGGEVGATRPAVDAGWTDYERQVGQTGTTVKPDLYIACGISGAVQHRVGMLNSAKIVAINNDPAAPIFRFAHVKIVADLTQIIPKLIEYYKA